MLMDQDTLEAHRHAKNKIAGPISDHLDQTSSVKDYITYRAIFSRGIQLARQPHLNCLRSQAHLRIWFIILV